MLLALIQVLFATLRAVARSSVNIMLYSVFSRVFNQWFGLNSFISFFCSAYCLSKIVNYFKRLWRNARLKNKKPDENLVVNDLQWQPEAKSNRQFETDWTFLLEDDQKSLFPAIVTIPFNNPWLFIATMMIIDYQMNNMNFSYSYSLVRTLGCLIVLICGSSIRYQTLFERERKTFLDVVAKRDERLERFLVYSTGNAAPVASACVQRMEMNETPIFMVQSFNLNSKFDDYLYDVENFLCQKLLEHVKNFVQEEKRSARLVWSIPSCRKDWTVALTANKFTLRTSYADFAFLPLVKSHVEQYELPCRYEELSSTTTTTTETNVDEQDKIKIE